MIEQYVIGSIVGISQSLLGHPLDTLKVYKQNKITKNLSFYQYYTGIKYPLILSAFHNSMLFGSYSQFNDKINNSFISGALSGGIFGIIISPFELYKTRSQLFKSNKISMFRGMPLAIMRESVGTATYFGSYYYMKNKDIHPFIAGGLSGWFSWFSCYPVDTIKTRIQSSRKLTYYDAFKQKKLWSGFKYCSYRAILVNACGFIIYEYLNNSIIN